MYALLLRPYQWLAALHSRDAATNPACFDHPTESQEVGCVGALEELHTQHDAINRPKPEQRHEVEREIYTCVCEIDTVEI